MMGRMAERGMELPDQLGRADRSMRDAREALRRGEPGDAMQGQNDALDQLRQGLNEMRQAQRGNPDGQAPRSEEHTSELQSLMRISYAVFCLKKNKKKTT